MKTLFSLLTKQYYLGQYPGAIKTNLGGVLFYLNPINIGMSAITAYTVTGGGFVTRLMPWFTVWHLLGTLVIVAMLAMVIEHKFVKPSEVAYANDQGAQHENVALKKMLARMDDINKQLEDIKTLVCQREEQDGCSQN